MKTYLNLVAAALLMGVSAGCATKYPGIITGETREKIKSVSVVKEVQAPTSITLPASGGGGGGLIGAAIAAGIQMKMQQTFNERLKSQINATEFLSKILYENFESKLVKNAFFTVKDGVAQPGDAAFVLEVKSAALGTPKAFSLSGHVPPELTVVATLVANPPFELMRDKHGEIMTEDPVRHPILYQKVVKVGGKDGLPYNPQNDYLKREIFEAAYSKALGLAVDKIMADWGAVPLQ